MLKYMGSVIGALFVSVFLATIATVAFKTPPTDYAATTVYVNMAAGHGSGFYIGNRQFITAAHVAAGATDGKLSVTANGKILSPIAVTVTWTDTDKDVALLTAADDANLSGIPAASLACGKPDPTVGDKINAIGFPLSVGKTQTWGRVAQNVGPRSDGPINFVGDLTVAPGNSGGPAFDQDGDVAGIVVALAVAPLNMVSASLVPLTYIVPRSVICERLNLTQNASK